MNALRSALRDPENASLFLSVCHLVETIAHPPGLEKFNTDTGAMEKKTAGLLEGYAKEARRILKLAERL